jgi:hypothetical protein
LIIKQKTHVLEPAVLGPSVRLSPSSTCLKAFAICPSLPPSRSLFYSCALSLSFHQNVSSSFRTHHAPFSSSPLFYMTCGGGSPTISRHGNGLKTPCLVQYFHLSLGEGEAKERALRRSLSLPTLGGTVVQFFRTCFFKSPSAQTKWIHLRNLFSPPFLAFFLWKNTYNFINVPLTWPYTLPRHVIASPVS